MQIDAIADPSRVEIDALNAEDTGRQIDALLKRLRQTTAEEAMAQVLHRMVIYLCYPCYHRWIENPTKRETTVWVSLGRGDTVVGRARFRWPSSSCSGSTEFLFLRSASHHMAPRGPDRVYTKKDNEESHRRFHSLGITYLAGLRIWFWAARWPRGRSSGS